MQQLFQSALWWYIWSKHPDLSEISILQRWVTLTLPSDTWFSHIQPPPEREGRGLLEKTGWSVDDSVLWPTTWMSSLLSSLEDECCTQAVSLPRQIWQTSLPACHLSPTVMQMHIRWENIRWRREMDIRCTYKFIYNCIQCVSHLQPKISAVFLKLDVCPVHEQDLPL